MTKTSRDYVEAGWAAVISSGVAAARAGEIESTDRQIVLDRVEELVRSRKKKHLTDLVGKIRFRAAFDHKAMRKLRA